MEATVTEFEALQRRVEGLERQNRWMRRAGCTMLLLLASALLMGQTRQPQTVRANNFSLVDAKGHIQAELAVTAGGWPALFFHDAEGNYNLTLEGGPEPTIYLGRVAKPSLTLSVAGDGPLLHLFDAKGTYTQLLIRDHAPQLELRDKEGYSAVLGTEDLITPRSGEKKTTSAASLVLFDKNRKVLWSAP